MLHDWQKVLESPVFRNGFKPMKGHDGDAEAGRKEEEETKMVSEHGKVQMEREAVVGREIEVAAH